jgi:hypothetical protein
VSAFAPWTGPQFKSADAPVSVQRSTKKQDKKDALDAAYRKVDKRDMDKCRATGVPLDPFASDYKHRREHHHLKGRNVKPEWREKPERICLVSKAVHDLINQGWIDVEGTDARKPLFFHYTALAKSRPVILKRHNKLPPSTREDGTA